MSQTVTSCTVETNIAGSMELNTEAREIISYVSSYLNKTVITTFGTMISLLLGENTHAVQL